MDQIKFVNTQIRKALPSLLFIHDSKNEVVWKVDFSGFGRLIMDKAFNIVLTFKAVGDVREEYVKKYFVQRLRNLNGGKLYTTNKGQIDIYARTIPLEGLTESELAIQRAENFIEVHDAVADFVLWQNSSVV